MKSYLGFFCSLLCMAACNRSPEYYFEQGNRLALSGRAMDSIEMYNKAILLKKMYPEALTSRAMVYEKLGDRQKAAYDYEKAIKMFGIDPSCAVFIDDLRENVEGAISAGMNGVVYTGRAQLIQDLRSLGINFLNDLE